MVERFLGFFNKKSGTDTQKTAETPSPSETSEEKRNFMESFLDSEDSSGFKARVLLLFLAGGTCIFCSFCEMLRIYVSGAIAK